MVCESRQMSVGGNNECSPSPAGLRKGSRVPPTQRTFRVSKALWLDARVY